MMQKEKDNYNSEERKKLKNAIEKFQDQIDALKYYLDITKSKEKSVGYIKVVVRDLENILRYEVKPNFKNIYDNQNSQSELNSKLKEGKLNGKQLSKRS